MDDLEPVIARNVKRFSDQHLADMYTALCVIQEISNVYGLEEFSALQVLIPVFDEICERFCATARK